MRIINSSNQGCDTVRGVQNGALVPGRTYKLLQAGPDTGFDGRYGNYTGELFIAGQSYAALREGYGKVDRMTHPASGRVFDVQASYTSNRWEAVEAYVCLGTPGNG